ncbi:MAG TPA: A/G-specific adenine glycosylase [Steroidobacteraceae bacterium]|nr:A/G-specific adenine glycosylase [Steroidobacteraceae bacterium]
MKRKRVNGSAPKPTAYSRQPAISLAPRLLAWFDSAGRKNLPWQRNPTPYRVWISEIMLQQTQVATVIPYYERFMQRFPDVETLACAPIDEVLHLWTGLGYYARARNSHRTAQLIVSNHGGKFPTTLDDVQGLPGIGRSTAGAILSLSMHQRHPILDGNVKRVLTRYFGIKGFPGEKHVESRLWTLADNCTPRDRIAHYTQAIMDLGATVCTRTRANCSACPLRRGCIAYRDDLQSSLPTRRPKRVRPKRSAFVIVAVNREGALLLERRPPAGIWGGLWTFPQFEKEVDARSFVGQSVTKRLSDYEHSFTHFDLTLRPLVLKNATLRRVADSDRYCWYDPKYPPRIGLATPVRDIMQQVVPCPAP